MPYIHLQQLISISIHTVYLSECSEERNGQPRLLSAKGVQPLCSGIALDRVHPWNRSLILHTCKCTLSTNDAHKTAGKDLQALLEFLYTSLMIEVERSN
mmetsp:Transcript_28582/g.54610  ORF Transcript_28582/g.54610 Transcript_28582/m.54610 type:complete len:99 (+) Transcript_28582:658-954(+)